MAKLPIDDYINQFKGHHTDFVVAFQVQESTKKIVEALAAGSDSGSGGIAAEFAKINQKLDALASAVTALSTDPAAIAALTQKLKESADALDAVTKTIPPAAPSA